MQPTGVCPVARVEGRGLSASLCAAPAKNRWQTGMSGDLTAILEASTLVASPQPLSNASVLLLQNPGTAMTASTGPWPDRPSPDGLSQVSRVCSIRSIVVDCRCLYCRGKREGRREMQCLLMTGECTCTSRWPATITNPGMLPNKRGWAGRCCMHGGRADHALGLTAAPPAESQF